MVAVRRSHEPCVVVPRAAPDTRGGRTLYRIPPHETSQYNLPPKRPCTTPRHSRACRTSPRDLPSSWPRGVSRLCRTRTAFPSEAIVAVASIDPAVPAVPGDCVKDRRVVLALDFQRAGVSRGCRPRAAGVFPLGFRRKRERKAQAFSLIFSTNFWQSSQLAFSTGRLGDWKSTRVLAHERFPERLSARRIEHPESFADRDLVLRSFVRVSPFLVIGRPHQEPSRRESSGGAGGPGRVEPSAERSSSSAWPRVSWAALWRSSRS